MNLRSAWDVAQKSDNDTFFPEKQIFYLEQSE